MPDYKILSLDGGGIRGLLTVRLLERLTQIDGLESAFDSVHLIAGNSSGALIALAMAGASAAKVPMKDALPQIRALFEDGASVFGKGLPLWLGGLWLLSKYRTGPRRKAFEARVKNIKLRELGTHVVVTSFDLDNDGASEELAGIPHRWKPKIFHNFKRADGSEPPNKQGIADREHLARDVALYSTAAPAYFPTVDGFIDGGVYANNPSMCALAQLLDKRYEPLVKPPLGAIAMFSVGAGRNATVVKGANLHWGAIPWGLHKYIELTTDATVGVADYQCRQMLGEENYRRCDVSFLDGVSFRPFDVTRVHEIRAFADRENLDDHAAWLKRNWMPRRPMITVPPDATSRHLLAATELTCLIPIKKGFVDVFETHTYATRVRIVLRTLHGLRQAAREVAPARVFPDIVDVIRSIHSFRLAVVGNGQLLLAVNFDRPWEPYMRVVWRELGALLDLMLINCEGYEDNASDKGFDRFAAWIRAHQVDTDLFYSASAHTVDDLAYLTQLEELVREKGGDPNFDAEAARLRLRTPEQLAHAAAARDAAVNNSAQIIDQGLRALGVFYKLREVYREGTPDEAYLRAAVAATLKTFKPGNLPMSDAQRTAYGRELAWFASLTKPAPATETRPAEYDEIQAGIIEPCKRVTHGCLLLARIEDPKQARRFLATLLDNNVITRSRERSPLFTSVAFTPQGLKRLGVPGAELAAFPKEFREGMDARAGLLGDVGAHHPDNWKLPEWNWDGLGARQPDDGQVTVVRLSTIDVVIQLRASARVPENGEDTDWANHPLRRAAHELAGAPCDSGIRVLSVQPMVQYSDDREGTNVAVEHFGFRDGISQPRPGSAIEGDRVNLGELVLGYENDRGDPPFFCPGDKRLLPFRERGGILDNGSFLVVRKLEQHVDTLHEVVGDFLYDNPGCGLTGEEVLGKLMGRDPIGRPTTGGAAGSNNFNYAHDDGSRCPLHAHIRRGNPRTPQPGPVPRIARRAMSFGPRYAGQGDDRERGMMFLAYNASIAEQYEVVQRWMTGGNSTGEFSGRIDPFLRVAQEGRNDTFLIPHNGSVLRMNLGDKPLVSLKWGLYLFVPSIATIRRLASLPKPDELSKNAQVSLGQRVIDALETDEHWRVALEDTSALSSGRTAAVCAAIRELHGGAVRTPGNLVLVATRDLAMKVLGDDEVFSVSEYQRRMRQSIGDIYLGHDAHNPDDPEYARLSRLPNQAISRVTAHEAFVAAQGSTDALLRELLPHTSKFPVRLSLEAVVDRVLAELSAYWFGIPDGHVIQIGGKPKDGGNDQSLYCPCHFLPPSRYIFSSPRPRDIVTGAGQQAGVALRTGVGMLARARHQSSEWPTYLPPIGQAVWDASIKPGGDIDIDLFARSLVGVMEGFLPTVFGNFWKTMHVWLTDETAPDTLWRVQQSLLLTSLPKDVDETQREFERAKASVMPALLRTMQARPVPDMVYRTATKRVTLGDVRVEQGDRVVVLIGSVTQELAGLGRADDVYPVFGGNRREAGHPTHACPGYEMALGVLLGTISAVLEAGTFTPTQTPLLVNVTAVRSVARAPNAPARQFRTSAAAKPQRQA